MKYLTKMMILPIRQMNNIKNVKYFHDLQITPAYWQEFNSIEITVFYAILYAGQKDLSIRKNRY